MRREVKVYRVVLARDVIFCPPMAALFAIAALFLAYAYVGYPALLLILGLRKKAPLPHPERGYRNLSILIPVYNEAGVIKRKIENSLQLDYPGKELEIVVASDGSRDGTERIVRSLKSPRIRFIDYPEHRGKASVINRTVPELRGEIVVFTDASALFASDALSHLVKAFDDPAVGAVSGELVLREEEVSDGGVRVDWYWKMEKFIRRKESALFSCPGATGAIYAIRRRLFQALPESAILDDFLIPLQAVRRGYRVLFEGRAKAYETAAADWKLEFRRKVRTLAGNYQAFALAPWLLLPWRSRIAFSVISHKLFRLLAPFALIIMLVATAFGPAELRPFFFIQAAFYLLAAAGLIRTMRNGKPGKVLSPAFTFCLLNAAAAWALAVYLFRRGRPAWK